jgi:predicted SprT family Zn-dependent metalloprotease
MSKTSIEVLTKTSDVVKTKKKSKDNYFDLREETAVVDFLNAKTFEEKNNIYNKFLRKPLDKMISSIIRRYRLYRKEMDFNDIHTDVHSFLMTKVDKFKPDKNKKAYSYFGTICKNYLMGQIMKEQKEMNRKISYEDISSSIENRPDMLYTIDEDVIDLDYIIVEYTIKLKDFVDTQSLNDNERKLGLALIDIFEKYETIFTATDNSKFNKNLILLSLREMTNLTTKEIRISLKKFKSLYIFIINKIV